MKIDKCIPLASVHEFPEYSGKKVRYPFSKMKVGNSIFIEEDYYINGARTHVDIAARDWAKARNNGAMFVSSIVDGGVRLWRTR